MNTPTPNINTFKRDSFLKNWNDTFKFQTFKDKERIIDSLKTLDNKSAFGIEMCILYETKTMMPLFVSKNIEKHLGYTPEEYLSWGIDGVAKIGGFIQKDFWKNIMTWFEDFLSLSPISTKSNPVLLRNYYVGRQYSNDKNEIKKYLVRTQNSIGANNTLSAFTFYRYKEISHLIKGDDYWIYFQKNADSAKEDIVSKFYSKNTFSNNALSNREKEIIKLIASGMSTKEVASYLYLSPDTVSQHRKNVLKRLNAKDTSSLIGLCKLCDII